jgi:hypothetical protein
MDDDRKIRFLVSPVLYLAAVICGFAMCEYPVKEAQKLLPWLGRATSAQKEADQRMNQDIPPDSRATSQDSRNAQPRAEPTRTTSRKVNSDSEGRSNDGGKSTARDELGLDISLSELIAIIAAGGVVIFALGVVIGTIGYLLLRLTFSMLWIIQKCLCCSRYCIKGFFPSHELYANKATFSRMCKHVGLTQPGMKTYGSSFVVGALFDHGVLRNRCEGAHRWVVRRWNALSVSFSSAIALMLALFTMLHVETPVPTTWSAVVMTLAATFALVAGTAWWDTMKMIQLVSEDGVLDRVDARSPKSSSNDAAGSSQI